MKRSLCTAALFLALLVAPLCAAKVKGGRAFKEHEKVVLVAEDVDKGSQILWDVSGECDVEEVEGKLFVWARPGSYTVTMTAVNFDTKKVTRARTSFTIVADAPPPAPTPDPGPKPPAPPPPSPAPIPAEGFRVLIVYETSELSKMPAAQSNILYAKSVRDYLNSKCILGDDKKTREWRMWDKDVATDAESKLWQDAMKRERKSLPWVIISDGKAGYEGPLPADADATLALLKKFGG